MRENQKTSWPRVRYAFVATFTSLEPRRRRIGRRRAFTIHSCGVLSSWRFYSSGGRRLLRPSPARARAPATRATRHDVTRRDARCGPSGRLLPAVRAFLGEMRTRARDVSRASRSSRDDGTASEGARAGAFTDSRDGSSYVVLVVLVVLVALVEFRILRPGLALVGQVDDERDGAGRRRRGRMMENQNRRPIRRRQ